MAAWFGKKDKPKEVSPGGSVIHRHESWQEPKLGFAERHAEFSKLRDEAYLTHFGEARQVFHEIIPIVPHIDVHEYYREGWPPDVCTLVTSGMSDVPMKIPAGAEVPRRVEIVFYCREPNKEYVNTMCWLAHLPSSLNTWLGAFHTIPNGNPPEPLWGTAMNTLFLLPPLVKADTKMPEKLSLDGDPVELLWLVPLTQAECDLKLAKGSDAILDLFTEKRHSHIFNPNRASYV
jgi:hypothetical protein